MSSWHEQSGKTPICNLNEDGCAWAACGKSLFSKQMALSTRGSSVNKHAGLTPTRFPTGCAGPWKTLVSIRRHRSHEMREQKRVSRVATTSFPQPLYRGQSAQRLLLVSIFNCQSSEQEVHIDHRLITGKQRCFVTEATDQRYSTGRLLRRPRCREVTFRHGHF